MLRAERMIPVAAPSITPREGELAAEAAMDAWGPDHYRFNARFEEMMADHVGVAHAVSVPHGTAALHLICLALDLRPGDEVIAPDVTWIASVAPIVYTGATPVLVAPAGPCGRAGGGPALPPALCREDAIAGDCRLPDGVVEGRRTVLFRRPWIDMGTGTILLPGRGRTVLGRGDRVNWNAASAGLGRPRVPVAGRVFAPVPTRNYFHLLVENGVRLLDLMEVPEIAAEALTVLTRPPSGRVERAMYEGLLRLYPRLDLAEMPRETLAVPDEAVGHFPANNHWEWPPVTRALADRLVETFAAVYGPAGPAEAAGERLYLARGGARLRAPVNEEALARELAAHSFAILAANGRQPPGADRPLPSRPADRRPARGGADEPALRPARRPGRRDLPRELRQVAILVAVAPAWPAIHARFRRPRRLSSALRGRYRARAGRDFGGRRG